MPMRQLETDTSALPEGWSGLADWRMRVLGETRPDAIDYLVRVLVLPIPATGTNPCPSREPISETTYLYRYYNEQGELLYVGITKNLTKRQAWHKKYSPWWTSAAEKVVEMHKTRDSARAAELQAIQLEDPIHNIEGKKL